MDFYLQPVRFVMDLAVDAKSCLNSNEGYNIKTNVLFMLIAETIICCYNKT